MSNSVISGDDSGVPIPVLTRLVSITKKEPDALSTETYMMNEPKRWSLILRVPAEYPRILTDVTVGRTSFGSPVYEPVTIAADDFVRRTLNLVLPWSLRTLCFDSPVLPSAAPAHSRARANFMELDEAQLEALDRHFERAKPLAGSERFARKAHLRKAANFFRSR